METLRALDVATEEFGTRLALVGDDAWVLPTPCPDWDVRYLVAHVVGGNRFAASVLGGMAASDAIERVMSSPQLGTSAMEAWATTCAAQAVAFHEVPSLDQRIDHPLGEITAAELLELRVFDIAIHAWDVAHAIGADERLAPGLVGVVLRIVENGRPGMGFGLSALGRVPADAPPQARLLDLAGRDPTSPTEANA
jgi:uncharacterized protein (TIGR03086 family)